MSDFSRATWRKSSHSDNDYGQCVELAAGPRGVVGVRDSKNPSGPILEFTRPGLSAFAARLRTGTTGT
ncbi:DUF397 domain-containing protein [Actinocorallia longicatena]|uniref:DUF397 domain-containing protein n=1 Tax=Actinocorallia longicatena TaxID=111803 RepID=A0ABP6QJF8_9ACTN